MGRARLLVLVDERLCVALLLSLGELIEHWTLRDDETGLVAVKHGDTQLAFALLLSSTVGTGASTPNRGELHPDAVEFMARAVKADPADLAGYDWSGRTIERHRTEIRQHFGFQQCAGRGGHSRCLVLPARRGGSRGSAGCLVSMVLRCICRPG